MTSRTIKIVLACCAVIVLAVVAVRVLHIPVFQSKGSQIVSERGERNTPPSNAQSSEKVEVKEIDVGKKKAEVKEIDVRIKDIAYKAEIDKQISDSVDGVDLKQILHEQVIPNLEKQKEEKALSERYESLKIQPQVIHGTIILPENDKREIVPVNLQLRQSAHPCGQTFGRTRLTRNGEFAFDPVEPGLYDVTIFEGKTNPGIEYTKVEVVKDRIVPSLRIVIPSGAVVLHLVNEKGEGVGGARITVGKGGAQKRGDTRFYTFRVGTSDAKGFFTASDLADGNYNVIADFGPISNSTAVDLPPASTRECTIKIRTSGSQIRGNVRCMSDSLSESTYWVVLKGIDSEGNPVHQEINTDSLGDFAFSFLPIGVYTVYIPKTGYYSGTNKTINVSRSSESINDVVLDVYATQEQSRIEGTVSNLKNSQGSPLHVLVLDSTGKVLFSGCIVNMTDGSFSALNVPPGEYSVTLMQREKDGGLIDKTSKRISVAAGAKVTRVDFALP